LKLSGLPHHKTLDEFDFAFQPELDARKVRDLATLEFVRAKSNVALLGPPGVGKTMIAVALAVAACQAGFSIYFTTLDDLVRRLRTAEATGRFQPTTRKPTYAQLCSWSTKSATSHWIVLKPTCCSNSSPAATNAAP
jgi:DNA replication protein DnaC